MHVTNTEPCTLVIGTTKIGYRETKPIEPKWEARCEELAARGALRIAGKEPKADAVPNRGDLLALIASLTPDERAALLAPKSEPAEVKADAAPTNTMDLSDPTVFAAAHVATCRAFVRGCNDLDLLCKLSEDETRKSLVDAISDRVKQLEEAAAIAAN